MPASGVKGGMTSAQLDARRRKLLHRARYRGFKEADILIGGFAECALASMDAQELDAFEALIGENDHDIYAWIVTGDEPPACVNRRLIASMRAFDAAGALKKR
jgi:antitoxin CptB